MPADDRTGHGWWPYVVPYVAFLLMSEIGARLPDVFDPALLVVKPGLTLAMVFWFRSQGAYPEWRGEGARIGLAGGLQDVAVGLALAALWVAPFVWLPALRPASGGEFDPEMAGSAFVGLILALRLAGYAVVTPIFEELFIRSFVMRIADVWNSDRDFRDQPLAHYTPRSMIVTTIVFTLGHVPWEWWVCVPWIVFTNLWFYHRRNLTSAMLVHGVTNGALLALAVYGEGLFRNPDGTALSLWFFV